MKNYFFPVWVLLVLAGASACSHKPGDDPLPATDRHEIGSALSADQYRVTLYADSSKLFTGFNKLYIKIEDEQSSPVSDIELSLLPEMDMGMHRHGCPVNPPEYRNTSSLFEAAAVFTMPSVDGDWRIHVLLNDDTVSFPVEVHDFETKVVGSFSGLDGEKYVLSLCRPAHWNVGLNDITFTLHRQEGPFAYPEVLDAIIEMTPEMPSMGHGSPNNVHPVSIGNGYYKGVVNFTMTGDWRMHLKVSRNGTVVLEDAALDILF